MPWTATLKETGENAERVATWRRVFGGLSVQLISPAAFDMVAGGRTGRFLIADPRVLSEGVLTRVCLYAMEQSGLSEIEIRTETARSGIPLLADDLVEEEC